MESSSRPSTRFRFRDHSESEIAACSDTDSDLSSVSRDDPGDGDDDDLDLESMTGKGIKHLCSELQELKLASNDEFHKNIFSNYTVFIRMFEQVEHLESELEQMKSHLSTQKVLVKELVDIACSEALSEEAMDSIVEEFEVDEPWCSSVLEDHINNVTGILDVLVLENRFEEALDVIDLEEENFQNMQLEDSYSLDDLRLYNSVISEKKAVLTSKLTWLSQNPRIAAPELHKALLALCRLGESDCATQLMLDYYDARIAIGISNLQRTISFQDANYIRELSKLVFPLIFQAARSFVILGGEAALIEWAKKETKAYVDCFNQHLKSVSELGGGLAMAVRAVQISMSFCSLLETRRLMLKSYLVKHIGPAIEELIHANIEHFKKVIRVFSASDSWVLGAYIVSGITNEGCYSMAVGQETECCMLTSSGRKFARLVKTIIEDVTPLFGFQMEGSIFSGLVNLYKEYVLTIEKALFYGSNVTEKNDSRINLAVSIQQQISILANLSALEQILPRILIRPISEHSHRINFDHINEHAISYQCKEIDIFTLFAQDASSRIRIRFCQQYVTRIMSQETSCKLTSHIGSYVQAGDTSAICDATPSVNLQTLFLELKKIERLAEGNIFDKEWLSEILRALVETIFVWISTNKDMWITSDENSTPKNSIICKQFVLDLKFLVQIAKYGGYFSNHPLVLENLMKSAFLSAEMISEMDINDNENLLDYLNETIQKLLEIEKTAILPNAKSVNIVENETIAADNSVEDDYTSFSDSSMGSDVDIVATNEPRTDAIAESYSLKEEYYSPQGDFLGSISSGGDADINLAFSSIGVGVIGTENKADEDGNINEIQVASCVIGKPGDGNSDFVGLQSQKASEHRT